MFLMNDFIERILYTDKQQMRNKQIVYKEKSDLNDLMHKNQHYNNKKKHFQQYHNIYSHRQ